MLVNEVGTQEDDCRVEKTIDDPAPENCDIEKLSLLSELVQLRVPVKQSGTNELVKDTHDKWREHSEEDIVEGQSPRFNNGLTRVTIGKHKPKLSHVQRDVLVKRIENSIRNTLVRPRAMDEKKFLQVPELTNGYISTSSCLHTFKTTDTNTDMSSLDHGNIIGTVTNG